TSMKSTSKGLFSKTTTVSRHFHDNSNAVASNVDGQAVSLIAQQGNISVKGSNVVAEKDLTLMAKENVSIVSDVNTHYQEDYSKMTKSGLMGSGGIGFTIGNKKETTEQDRTQESAASSQVGSLKGNTTIQAGNHYQQTGSVVTAVNGDVDILAKSVNITAAQADYESNYKYTMEQKGLTIALSAPVLNMMNAVISTVNSAKNIGASKDDRINALAAANSGWAAYRLAQNTETISNMASDLMKGNLGSDGAGGTSVGVSITYGQQKNVSTTHTEGNTAQSSEVNAGGKVNIVATAAGKQSDINIIGSDVSGKQGTSLKADNDINLLAAKQAHQERSANKSSGFNAGVAIQFGNGVSFGVTAGGNYGKGYGNGDEITYTYSHIGDKNSQTTLESGATTNLKGVQVQGKGVKLDAQNLNIESLQETLTYKGKQMNVSGQVTVGYGFSASGSYNQSKMNADYASVIEQSGIYAGDDGYQINVQNDTDLKGGLITSSQTAEDNGNNRFETGTLSYSDIRNHADYSGSSFGVGGGFSMGGGDKPKEIGGMKLTSFGQNAEVTKVNQDGTKTTEIQGKMSGDVSVGIGHDSEHDSSVTLSGINTANINIRDENFQFEKIGKTVETTKVEVKTDITTESAVENSGKLAQNFDKEKVLKELNIQVKVTQDFRKNAFATIDAYVLPKQAELREKIKQAKTEEEKTALYDEIYKLQYQKRLLETVVGIVAGSPELAITQGTLQLAATKMREETLANSRIFKGIKDAKTGEVLRNDSYDSGYFDGVKLGGVRIDVNLICGQALERCLANKDGSYNYIGDQEFRTLSSFLKSDKAKDLYGPTGGFQSIEGGWYWNGKALSTYNAGDIGDLIVESFAGAHDMLGGQIWGWYDKSGNTSRKDGTQQILADTTTAVAIPITAPLAVSDLISSDFIEVLFKLGGN
ncbi:MAG: hemagglutinin repeat-containing protein, partial [[Pasteurella] aerogenes]|nr:hemagglutinin repeat-containing protein [[Pasteurella] aerogenes]